MNVVSLLPIDCKRKLLVQNNQILLMDLMHPKHMGYQQIGLQCLLLVVHFDLQLELVEQFLLLLLHQVLLLLLFLLPFDFHFVFALQLQLVLVELLLLFVLQLVFQKYFVLLLLLPLQLLNNKQKQKLFCHYKLFLPNHLQFHHQLLYHLLKFR